MAEQDKGSAEDGVRIAGSPEEEGLFFENPALKGSGTIRRDGTYGPPAEDPTVARGLGPDRTSGGRLVVHQEGHALFGEEAEANLTDEERKTLEADKDSEVAPAEKPAAAPKKAAARNA